MSRRTIKVADDMLGVVRVALLRGGGELGGQVAQGEVDQALLCWRNSVAGLLRGYSASRLERTVEGCEAWWRIARRLSALVFGMPPNSYAIRSNQRRESATPRADFRLCLEST